MPLLSVIRESIPSDRAPLFADIPSDTGISISSVSDPEPTGDITVILGDGEAGGVCVGDGDGVVLGTGEGLPEPEEDEEELPEPAEEPEDADPDGVTVCGGTAAGAGDTEGLGLVVGAVVGTDDGLEDGVGDTDTLGEGIWISGVGSVSLWRIQLTIKRINSSRIHIQRSITFFFMLLLSQKNRDCPCPDAVKKPDSAR